jgi:hypothetical protein
MKLRYSTIQSYGVEVKLKGDRHLHMMCMKIFVVHAPNIVHVKVITIILSLGVLKEYVGHICISPSKMSGLKHVHKAIDVPFTLLKVPNTSW